MFDLKKTESYLLKSLKLADLASTEQKDDTYFKIRIPPGFHFPHNKDIDKCLNKALNVIMKDDPIKTNLPEEYVKEQIENILFLVFSQPKPQRPTILNEELTKFREIIKKKLKNEIKDYIFTLHVTNLFLEENITIGDVKFYKLDKVKLNEIKSSIPEGEQQFFQKFIESKFLNEGDTYVEVCTHGIQDYAYSLALYKIRLAMNIIKLYIDPDYCNFGLDGETHVLTRRTSLLYYDDTFGFLAETVGGRPDYTLRKDSIEFMEKNGFKELNSILQKSKLFEYENRLLTGIYWFGEAVSTVTSDNKNVGDGERSNPLENFEFFKRGEKLIKLVTALESVLIFNKNEKITENIAERAAMIIGENYATRMDIKKQLRDIYGFRSNLVHKGVTYISKNDLTWLTDCARAVLYKLIELKTENDFEKGEDLRRYIEKLRLS